MCREGWSLSRSLRPLHSARARRARATTVVDLVVGMTIAGILMVAVGSIMVVAARSSVEANQRLEIDRSARHAMSFVSRRARSMSFDTIEIADGGARLILDPDGASPESYYAENGNFVRANGAHTEDLVSGIIAGVAFALLEGHTSDVYVLRMTLNASDGVHELELEETTMLRN